MDSPQVEAAILIPCFNAAPHLRQCLESAFAQRCDSSIAQAYPILLCDDGSTDNSLEIAESYPISIIKSPINLGVGRTRQRLVEEARSMFNPEFIQFLDADDFLISPNKISNQLAHKEGSDALIDPLLFIYPNGDRRTVTISPNLKEAAIQGRIWQLNACLFRASKIPTFRPCNACSDSLFLIDCIKACLVAKQVSNSPTSAYRKNWSGNQITANHHEERRQLSIAFAQEIATLIDDAKLQ